MGNYTPTQDKISNGEQSENDTIVIVLLEKTFSCQKEDASEINNTVNTWKSNANQIQGLSFYLGLFEYQPEYSEECIWVIKEPTDIESCDEIFVLDEIGSIMGFNLSDNDSILIKSSGESYPSGMYEIRDTGVLVNVCKRKPVSMVLHTTKVGEQLSLVVLLLSFFSCLCLTWTIRHFVKQRRKSHLQLSMAISSDFLLFLIPPFMYDVQHICNALAILRSYACLAIFVWMNIIMVDTWLASRSSGTPSDSNVYCILGWGIPLVLTTISIGMNFAAGNDTYKPHFGGYRCSFTETSVMLQLFFGVITACSILLNVPIFILTFINIRRATPPFVQEFVQTNTANFLFFICITVTWIFEYISKFKDQKVAHFIFTVLLSLQGIFLLACFICYKGFSSKICKYCGPGPATNREEIGSASSVE